MIVALRSSALVSLVLVAGCSSDDGAAPPHADAGAPTTTPRAVAFDDAATLDLAASEVSTLSVSVVDQAGNPVAGVPVRFALLGEHADASLESSTDRDRTDDAGHASTRLHASTATTTFLVRATIDGAPPAERGVGVSGEGFATLSIAPSYTGKRHIDLWTVTATAGATCMGRGTGILPDGPLASTGPPGAPITLAGVPVGSRVMVTLRSARAIGGCVDVEGLVGSETRAVPALAANVPLVIIPASLALTFDVTPETVPWVKVVDAWKVRFAGAFLGGAASGAPALLDTMAASLSPAQASLFQTTRAAKGWDATTQKALGTMGPDLLLAMWLPPAVASLKTSPPALVGQLTAPVNGPATFAPTRLLGLESSAGDAPTPKAFAWSGGDDDEVKAAGSLSFWPSRVLAAAVAKAALVDGPQGVPAAMGAEDVCPSVGTSLAPSGPAFGTCNSACLRDLCKAAFTTMWNRARHADEDAGVGAVLALAAAGAAVVDGDAHLVSFSGAWAGSITDGSGSALAASVKGAAAGVPASSSTSTSPLRQRIVSTFSSQRFPSNGSIRNVASTSPSRQRTFTSYAPGCDRGR